MLLLKTRHPIAIGSLLFPFSPTFPSSNHPPLLLLWILFNWIFRVASAFSHKFPSQEISLTLAGEGSKWLMLTITGMSNLLTCSKQVWSHRLFIGNTHAINSPDRQLHFQYCVSPVSLWLKANPAMGGKAFLNESVFNVQGFVPIRPAEFQGLLQKAS